MQLCYLFSNFLSFFVHLLYHFPIFVNYTGIIMFANISFCRYHNRDSPF